MKKTKKNWKKISGAVIAMILVVVMVIGLWPSNVINAYAQASDMSTADTWKESLGEDVSTQYAGRIWTDKSVYTDDVSFELFAEEGEEHPIANIELEKGEDFIVAYSALATAQAVSGQTQAPVDVVFVVDISGSMDDSMRAADGSNSTRIAETVKALNKSVDSLMNMNKNTRVGIVVFSSTATAILPLGHYEKGSRTTYGSTVTDYFSLSGTTLHMHVIPVTGYEADGDAITGRQMTGSYSVTGGTNIQKGIHAGMNMLATADSTSVDVNGQKLQRYPSVVLLSDGAPTYSSSDSAWWAPANNDDNGPGNGAYYGNGMKALMTGAYMKDAIDRNYGLEDSKNGTTFYTIGMGITGLSANEQALAYMTLNPGAYWKDESTQGIPAGTYQQTSISFDYDTNSRNTGISSITCNRIVVDNQGNATAVLTIRKNRTAEDITSITVNGTNYNTTNAGNRNFTVEIPIVLDRETSVTITNAENDSYVYTLTATIDLDSTTDAAKQIAAAWETYATKGTPSVQTDSRETYTFNHPNTGYDILGKYSYNVIDENNEVIQKEGNALQALVDSYYDADDANSVAAVFEQIVTEIALNTAQVPTAIQTGKPLESTGWIIYEDPIGEYLEVKNLKQIIYGGHQFTLEAIQEGHEKWPSELDTANASVYVAHRHLRDKTNTDTEIHSGVYAGADAADIIVMIKETNGKQILSVHIPASTIPVRINTITLRTAIDADGNTYQYVSDHTNNGTYPVRVVYGVGLKEGVVKEVQTEKGKVEVVNTEVVSKEYIAKHTNPEDGSVNFYSNYWDGTNTDTLFDGKTYTAGNAKVTFVPAATNPFYFLQEDTPIYLDDKFQVQATAIGGLDDNTTYYYKDTYYYLKDEVTTALARTGAQLKNSGVEYIDGVWHRTAGTARKNRIVALVTPKTENTTNTAELYYAPQYDPDHSIQGSTTGHMTVWLGNNGLVTKAGSGILEISKSVTADEGLTAPIPNNGFEFTVELINDDNEYEYEIIDNATKTANRGGTITKDNRKIYLYDGETARIKGLVYGTEYRITETPVSGYTVTPAEATGTITVGEIANADFNNHYQVASVTWPTNDELAGTKELIGRKWKESDTFTFLLTPFNNAPLPNGEKEQVAKTVTGESVVGTNEVKNFNFGEITFTEPGEYRYTVVEKQPEAGTEIPGISYSRALYRIVITVEDNKAGQLEVTQTDIQKLYDDDGTQVAGGSAQDAIKFVNTYDAQTITKVPVAVKAYTDTTGQMPLTSGMFKFRLTPNGILTNSGLDNSSAAIQKVPMPLDGNSQRMTEVVAANEGVDIVFLPIHFDLNHLGAGNSEITYQYKLEELQDNAIPGMTYQTTPEFIDITLSLNAENVLEVHASYEAEQDRLPTFVNVYEPSEAKVTLHGQKTLFGRDMADGEEYTFTLSADSKIEEVIVKDAANGEAVSFEFGELKFKKPGTYHFTIAEKIPSDATNNVKAGVTYDNHKVNVEVIVEDNKQGQLVVASVTYDNSSASNADVTQVTDKAAFVNVYQPKFTGPTVSLDGTKNLTGQTLEAQEFRFGYTTDIDPVNGKATANATWHYVTNHAGTDKDGDGTYAGSITFLKDVTYTAAGTYTYIIGEYIPEHAILGMTNDTTVYRLVVKVTDDGVGNLSVSSQKLSASTDYRKVANPTWSDAVNVVFNNFYKPAAVQFQTPLMTKLLEGANREIRVNEFQFQRTVLSATEEDGIVLMKDEKTEADQKKDIVANGANGVVAFGPMKFTKAGTYVVQIAEVLPKEADGAHYDMAAGAWVKDGVYYTSKPLTATFVVEDDQRGTLTVHVTNVTGSTFVNTYEAVGVLSLQVRKDFAGRQDNEWLDTDAFTFTINPVNSVTKDAVTEGDIVLPKEITIRKTNANKAAWFEDIYIYKEGEYIFEIAEDRSDDIAGVIYADARQLKVLAKDQGNGALTITYDMLDTSDELQEAPIVFKNVYKPGSTILSGSKNLKVDKTFTGRQNNQWLYNSEYKDTFVFTLNIDEKHTTTKKAFDNGEIVFANQTLTVTRENKDDAYFGDITFHVPGLYKFLVTETKGEYAYITYDTEPRVVWINVVDNQDGTMTATIKADTSDQLTFKNTYTAAPTAPVILTGTKEISGRALKSNDKFEFTITAVTGGAPMPADKKVYNNANGEIAFGPIQYDAVGTYIYEIKETGGEAKGVTNAKNVVKATVTVTDNNNGQLISSVTYSQGGFKFVNTYKTTPTNPITISAVKTVTSSAGNSYKMKAGDFDFTIVPAEPNGNPITSATVSNDANGNVVFAKDVKFEKAGTYVYVIQETDGNLGGMSYSQVVYTITIQVKDDEENAKLGATILVEQGLKGQTSKTTVTNAVTTQGENQQIALSFENKYNPSETNANISGKKALNVTGNPNVTLQAGDFTFKLEAVGGAPMPANANNGVATIKNGATGEFAFGAITYKAPGTYQYKVSEVNDGKDGYSYDDAVYNVTVVVEDKNGRLTVTENTSGNGAVVFTNTYKPKSVTLEGDTAIKGKKTLTGRDMNAEEFSFTITPAKDSNPMPQQTVVKNAKDGSFAFGAMTFEAVGEYTYTITEQKGTLGGMTYDETIHTVVVTVTDKGGYLDATVTYPQNGVGFENAYQATVFAKVSLDAKKKLSGRVLKEGEFTFQLIDKDGKVVATATNGENGAILFEALTFDKVGEYVYLVKEVKGDAKGITYDEVSYTVTIKVTDDFNGSLKAETVLTKDGQSVETMEFVNTYKDSAPQTGDMNTYVSVVVMLLLAASGIALTFKKRRVTN